MARFGYCLNSSTIRPAPILKKIEVAAAAGYGAIELWHDDIDLYLQSGGTLRDLRKAIDDSGLAIPTTIYIKGWFQPAGEEHRQAMDEIKRRLEQSAAVGSQHIIAGPPAGKADRELGAKHYHELLELGRQFGVKPAMEYLGFVDDINTIEDALEIMRKSGHPDATIVIDPFHCFRGGGSIESIAKLTSNQIAISHFNDSPASPPRETQHDADRVMPGDGIVDLKRYCELLSATGYNRWLSLELFREDLWQQDPLSVAKRGIEKMRAFVEG